MSIIYQLKYHFSQAAFSSGSFDLLTRFIIQKKAFVLMYHRVLDPTEEEQVFVQPGMYVSTETFRLHVALLKERFQIIPLGELIHRSNAGKNIGGCCAITFDDGWADNFINAFPILTEFRIPATIFLASGLIGTTRSFWPEELCFHLQRLRNSINDVKFPTFRRFINEIGHMKGEDSFYERAISVFKDWQPNRRDELLNYLRSTCPAQVRSRWLMSWQEARDMLDSGLVTYGAHTSNHVILDQVSLYQAEQEIVRSRDEIQSQLKCQVDFFAYPNGNFNNDLQDILHKYRFLGAFTTRKDWFDSRTHLFEIPRIGVHEDIGKTEALFLARILLSKF